MILSFLQQPRPDRVTGLQQAFEDVVMGEVRRQCRAVAQARAERIWQRVGWPPAWRAGCAIRQQGRQWVWWLPSDDMLTGAQAHDIDQAIHDQVQALLGAIDQTP